MIQQIHREFVEALLPKRDIYAHKGMFGRVLMLCGSVGYTGAASLAAMGALRTGAGLVYLGVPESIYAIEACKLTEPIVMPLPELEGKISAKAWVEIQKLLPKINAVLMGPGLGQSDDVLQVIQAVIRNFSGPIVIDADGINVLKDHMYLLQGRTIPVILTPHMGEFSRIGGNPEHDRLEEAISFAKRWECILVLKGHDTIITDGYRCYVNPTGNPGMAVGGSGDVLSGMIASFIGQGITPIDAAAAAVWLHGSAGDVCAAEIGQYGMLPTDMLNVLPRLMK